MRGPAADVRLRDWLYIKGPGSKRGWYGFVFTIADDGCVHVWMPRRSMGHRIVTSEHEVQVVCRNVRLKQEGPSYLSVYSSHEAPWSGWQTLSTRK
jgi:hypothetical protein